MMPSVGLVPMGEIPRMALKVMAGNIAGYMGLAVDILPETAPPLFAFDPLRRQFNAATVIQSLESGESTPYDKILGILAPDLFLPIFTYVFGDARMGGRVGVLSLFQLSRQTPHTPLTELLVLERASKVALHELGHLFCLVHCPDAECVMHFTGDLASLDRSPLYYCRSCMHQLHAALLTS